MFYFICSGCWGGMVNKVSDDVFQELQSVSDDIVIPKKYFVSHKNGYDKVDADTWLKSIPGSDPHEYFKSFTECFRAGDIVWVQHPVWYMLQFESALLQYFHALGVKIILNVDDVMTMQWMTSADRIVDELKLFEYADVLILHSEMMYYHLLEYGANIDRHKVVYRTLYDYICDFNVDLAEVKPVSVVNYTGNMSKMFYDWAKLSGVGSVITYGSWDPVQSVSQSAFNMLHNMQYGGFVNNDDLFDVLSGNGGYGLVWVDDKLLHLYYRYNLPYKLTNYLVAGLPVIVYDQAHYARFVTDNKIGFAVSRLEDIASVMSGISESDYCKMYENVVQISKQLCSGEFGKRTCREALSRLKDAK